MTTLTILLQPFQTTSFQAREVALQSDLKAKSELAASLKEEIRNLKDEVDIMKKKLQVKLYINPWIFGIFLWYSNFIVCY